jgi:lipopolysaccharide export LptBFGC system permease protein LptF
MILFMGMFGAYLLYSSGKAASSKSQWSFLIGGFAVLLIALIVGFSIIKIKMGG